MERYERITEELLTSNIGNYIRLEGMGILSGYSTPPTKLSLYLIHQVDEHALKVKRYRCKNRAELPRFNWYQGCEIYSPAEYKALPAYPWS